MTRYLYTAGCVLMALGLALFVKNAVSGPISASRKNLQIELEELSPDALDVQFHSPLDYAEIQATLGGRSDVWAPLVAPPQVRKPEPKLEQLLKGVRPTRSDMGTGPDRKVKIRLGPNDRRGQWKGVGDTVNGCTIKSISDTAVVFSRVHGEKELVHSISRGR